MRYILMITLILFSSLTAGNKKFVVDLTTGDIETFESRFLNGVPGTIRYFKSQGDEVETSVVVHGDAYKFFVANLEHTKFWEDEKLVKAQKRLHAGIEAMLKDHPITIEMCSVGMKKHQILSQDLYPFVTPIPSAMSGLIRWQNAGFAYVPIR